MKFLSIITVLFSLITLFQTGGCSATGDLHTTQLVGKIFTPEFEQLTGIGLEETNGNKYRIMKESPVYFELMRADRRKTYILEINHNKSPRPDLIYVISFHTLFENRSPRH